MTFNLQAPPLKPRNAVERRIARLSPWFHNLRLPGGEQTAPNHPLGDFPRYKWDAIAPHIPADLTGRTALDIGCNAGFYSLELARRGCTVYGIDHDEHYLAQARWVARQWKLHGRVEFLPLDVWDLARQRRGLPDKYDIVLFMGVFYHLRHPLLGLDIAAMRTRELMVFQSLTTAEEYRVSVPEDLPLSERGRLRQPGWPRMSFIERSFASDGTNWWIPDPACCEALLRSVGMRIVAGPDHETWICRPRRGRPARTPPELARLLGGAGGTVRGRRGVTRSRGKRRGGDSNPR